MAEKFGTRGFRVEMPFGSVYWVIAESPGKAKHIAVSEARRAGASYSYKHTKCRRCPEIDGREAGVVHWSSYTGAFLTMLADPPAWEQPR